jgi:hypothetical protein
LERDENIAEWIRLTDGISAQVAPKSVGRPESGINAASRELGIERTNVQRAVKVDSLSDEAKAAAVEHELDDNIAEWIRLTDGVQVEPHHKAGQKPGGVSGGAPK